MVISQNHPTSWEEETWTEHVVCVPKGYQRDRPAEEAGSERVIAVRDPLPIARVRMVHGIGLPATEHLTEVGEWPTTGENPDGGTLHVTSIETTPRFEDFQPWFEHAILRFAKEHAIERVQVVVPIAVDDAKSYEPFTRVQLVLWNEAPSPLVQTLISEAFRPISYRADPIGIEIAFQWTNDFR